MRFDELDDASMMHSAQLVWQMLSGDGDGAGDWCG